MKTLIAKDYPNLIWEFGSSQVKKLLREMRIYARDDFEIPENEIEEIVKEAMSVYPIIESNTPEDKLFDDELAWESLNLVIL